MECLHCQAETTNPKFCTQSCAAKHTNKTPKRPKTRRCSECDELVRSNRKRCPDCIIKFGLAVAITLKDAVIAAKGSHRASAHSVIRERARRICSKLGMNSCEFCGYDKHIEICHVKAISDHHEDTLISDINSIENLKALCPNCHWEFDNLPRRKTT